ncbi:hypothetical protein SLI_2174 [Streptomyces lividans 1326]|uniref:Uncharacterized protein n=1 Tax=Streptomyces lividans 1326 TaxID=1200984 RepID=A0A7U9DMU6_STRLI|nr:hypothetical protein SLI_2174 [Streptomyces lividans 1326]
MGAGDRARPFGRMNRREFRILAQAEFKNSTQRSFPYSSARFLRT